MSTAQFPSIAEVLEHGRRVVVSDEFLDWVAKHRPALAVKLRTIPNPDRVGILDRWVASTQPLKKESDHV